MSSVFDHRQGKLVKYNNKALVVGGFRSAPSVEEMNDTQLSWAEHQMSPVYGSGIWTGQLWVPLVGFTALSLEKSLFIFGE